MTCYLEVDSLTLDIPILDVSRSFRKSLVNRYTGGEIQKAKKSNTVSVRALDNISFRLEKGDRLGLVGHNGAGKTTLLRLLAGVYRPLIGTYSVKGKVTPLFNMSVGLDTDDTGEENISTIGMYLGMSKQEIQQKKDSIIEFSELDDFIHLPVRTYSAGMQTRLSFAVATAIEPDILLMDEGIGAGDANFAHKAEKRLEDFYSKIGILVLASHSDELIRKLCNKAVLLDHGKIKAAGSVSEILNAYHKKNSGMPDR